MSRVDRPPRALRRVLAAAAPFAPMPALAAAASNGDDGLASGLAMLLSLVLALLLAVAIGLVAWSLARHNRRLAAALRDARQQARHLDEMLDLWQWQTDRQHRLTALRPPQGAPAADWSRGADLLPLWEFVGADDEAALRSQLERHARLDDLLVQRRGTAQATPAAPVKARLRGRVRVDALGAFDGYSGTLRELPAVAVDDAGATANEPAAPTAAESDSESFGYTVSHDLRAPIRVVEGFTKILKEDYGRLLDRIGNDHLDRVLGAAARMNSMIDALLALSRLSSQPLARQPVDLSQLARYVGDDLRRQSPGREVALHIEPGLRATGDPTLLRLVIENLLGNAWKYTGRCAQPEIWLERQGEQSHVYTVRDNGAGFDMRFADRLFGVFQRLHSASEFPGTGVGLASVRRIVRRHGGDVWAEAEVGRGASFHFSLGPSA